MIWDDVDVQHTFNDGSIVTQRHTTTEHFCYRFKTSVEGGLLGKTTKEKMGGITVSEDHFLLCDLSGLKAEFRDTVLKCMPEKIPLAADVHFKNIDGVNKEWQEIVEYDDVCLSKKDNLYWLSAYLIYWVCSQGKASKIKLVSDLQEKKSKSGKTKLKYKTVIIIGYDYVGKKECFCVSTDTGRYKVCGLVHHNSVALRNMLLHALTHGEDIKLALTDLKLSEFSVYKGLNNVVGVSNTVAETVELLRLCRTVMQKRNQQNADRGITNFTDWQPQQPTDKIKLFNSEFNENDVLPVEINGEQKEMTVGEILEFVKTNY